MTTTTTTAAELMHIPGPPGLPLIGNLLDLRNGDYPLQAIERLADQYGPIFSITNQGNKRVFISSVKLANELCDDDQFWKQGVPSLSQSTTRGLFTAPTQSEDWAIAHRVLMPAFGPLSIESLFDEMHDVAKQLALAWARKGPDEPLIAAEDFTRLTLDTIALCAMGYRFNSFYRTEQHPYVKAMLNVLTQASRRGTRPAIFNKMMTGEVARLETDRALQREVGQEIIRKRRSQGSPKQSDLLDKMLNGKDPKTGKTMDDDLIAANMNTFLTAGHETTSSLLSFVMFNLLKNPNAYKTAQKEVDEVIGDSSIRLEHLKQLKYLNATLRETLRLYPTAPSFTRTQKPDAEGRTISLGGYALDQGVSVSALLGKIQRDPEVYGSDAEEFKPERMLDENFQRLPENAWKPFGTGVRACIGRAFAWQEALLAMALLLQRFDFELVDPDYDLRIQFNLTIKPKDLRIQARLRHDVTPTELEILMNFGQTPRKTSQPGSKRDMNHARIYPMTILVGSNTGTCEALAQRLATEAKPHGYSAAIKPLDSAVGTLPKSQPVVIITASYEGQPPENARRFVGYIERAAHGSFEGVQYAVFGCGHRDWVSTFQRIPTLIDETIQSCGAQRLIERGLSDVASGQVYDDFDDWKDSQLWPRLSKNLETGDISVAEKRAEPDIEIFSTKFPEKPSHADFFETELLEARVLTVPDKLEKRHCEFRLPDGAQYQPGDYLAVMPQNSSELIDRALYRFGLSEDTCVKSRSGSASSLPQDHWLAARDILGRYVELSKSATLKDLKYLARIAADSSSKPSLDGLIDQRSSTPQHPTPSPLEMLLRHPTLPLEFPAFLSLLPPMRPRLYSISSSPLAHPSSCIITYSVHARNMRQTSSDHNSGTTSEPGTPPGVTSSFLAGLNGGDVAAVAVRRGKPGFCLPPSPATNENNQPLLMICAGTGLAPFRGFIEHRASLLDSHGHSNEAHLIIGNRTPHTDRLYGAELDYWAQLGVVNLHYAFSQEPEKSEGCRYVGDVVRRERGTVKRLWKGGARVLVCGGLDVVEGVRGALVDALIEDEEARRETLQMEVRERVVADVFG